MEDDPIIFFPFALHETIRLSTRITVLNFLPKNAIGAEIGVFRGHFSEFMLERLTPSIFYMVDPWTKGGEKYTWGTDYTADRSLTTAYAKKEVEARTKRFKDKTDIRIHEEYSHAFFAWLKTEIENGREERLDYIYIDASHNYEETLKELQMAVEVLGPEGIISGDDWYASPDHVHHGVFRAVNDFLKECATFQIVWAGPGKQFVLRRAPNYNKPKNTA